MKKRIYIGETYNDAVYYNKRLKKYEKLENYHVIDYAKRRKNVNKVI